VSGNQRVFYACLGVKQCNSPGAYQGVISGAVSLNRSFNTIAKRGSTNPVATYGELPDVEFTYKSYLNNFSGLDDEAGVNDPIGLDLVIGNDTSPLLNGGSSVRVNYALLSNITISMPVDGFFTIQKTYKGFVKETGSGGTIGSASNANVPRRQFYIGGAPEQLVGALQNVEISIDINRTFIPQFATRKPYASAINFPIQSSVTFDVLAQGADGYGIDALYSACQNPRSYKTNLSIQFCGGGIGINKAYITSLKYSGGDANTPDNLRASVTYTSYSSPQNIEPIIIMDTLQNPCE
jgi:hypothetical protein